MWLQLSLVSRKCQVTVATEREFFKGSFLVLKNWLAKYTTTSKGVCCEGFLAGQTSCTGPSSRQWFPTNEIDLNFWFYNKVGGLGLDVADHGGQKPKLCYNDIGNQILLGGFFSPKGYSTLAESTVFGQKFLFFVGEICWQNRRFLHFWTQ